MGKEYIGIFEITKPDGSKRVIQREDCCNELAEYVRVWAQKHKRGTLRIRPTQILTRTFERIPFADKWED